ncbi:ATPase [Thiorhodococcus mannitoliphagus]|uniref:ATPase n=1 Tax=Thiorhodococcus mannitoliphagus TaxID=329406 RepID=A0A6P1DZS4_9GAMM|nr:V-type ATP synthase subunit F [Thiorhodococcus mannitoliphagus]NEX21224.1 ATPase [Thiorhodococcus mannitoliphagus]
MSADIPQEQTQPTRMLFLGDDRLADGFRLIGFETHPNPSEQEAEQVFRDLLRQREKAFVIVDDALMHQRIPSLRRVLDEGGRIVVIAVPALGAAPKLTSDVAQRLSAMFGAGALEPGQTEER